MEDPTNSVVLDGTIRDGQSVEQVVVNLAKLFRTEEAKVRFLVAGKQVIIKKRLPQAEAQRYKDVLEKAGAVCHLEAQELVLDLDSIAAENPAPNTAVQSLPTCPKCCHVAASTSDELVTKGTCPKCGIVVEKYLKRQKDLDRPDHSLLKRGTSAYCRNCGKEINEKAEICVHCGDKPFLKRNFCQECGAHTRAGQELCIKCGVRLKTAATSGPRGGLIPVDFSNLEPYYRQEFQQMFDSNEQYTGKWNWAAFLFGPIWALSKGAWLAPLICLLVGVITWGVGFVIYGFIFGCRGNFIYYSAFVKNRQLWA